MRNAHITDRWRRAVRLCRGKLSLNDGQLSFLMLMPNNSADADGVVVVAVADADADADAVDTGAEYDAYGWDKVGSCTSIC